MARPMPGVAIKESWLQQAKVSIQQQHPACFQASNKSTFNQLLLDQLLLADLNQCGASNLPRHVQSMGFQCEEKLEGKYLLQIDEIVNIAAPWRHQYTDRDDQGCPVPRQLKLLLTDGITQVAAVEDKIMKDVSVLSPAGVKALIWNAPVKCGVIFLTPQNCIILGGRVNYLEHAHQRVIEEWRRPAVGRRGAPITSDEAKTRLTHAAWSQDVLEQEGSARGDEEVQGGAGPTESDAVVIIEDTQPESTAPQQLEEWNVSEAFKGQKTVIAESPPIPRNIPLSEDDSWEDGDCSDATMKPNEETISQLVNRVDAPLILDPTLLEDSDCEVKKGCKRNALAILESSPEDEGMENRPATTAPPPPQPRRSSSVSKRRCSSTSSGKGVSNKCPLELAPVHATTVKKPSQPGPPSATIDDADADFREARALHDIQQEAKIEYKAQSYAQLNVPETIPGYYMIEEDEEDEPQWNLLPSSQNQDVPTQRVIDDEQPYTYISKLMAKLGRQETVFPLTGEIYGMIVCPKGPLNFKNPITRAEEFYLEVNIDDGSAMITAVLGNRFMGDFFGGDWTPSSMEDAVRKRDFRARECVEELKESLATFVGLMSVEMESPGGMVIIRDLDSLEDGEKITEIYDALRLRNRWTTV